VQDNEAPKRKMHILNIILTIILIACSSSRPQNLGVVLGRLSDCPSSPNCCSSQSMDQGHFIAPLQYKETQQIAQKKMITLIQGMKRAKIITVTNNYLHAEFTSAFFRFVDDAEIWFEDSTKTIHMRSAARLGYYDFGVNRKRIEAIKSEYQLLSEQKQ
jgi:uncharacterized protein (DUF1499 family)